MTKEELLSAPIGGWVFLRLPCGELVAQDVGGAPREIRGKGIAVPSGIGEGCTLFASAAEAMPASEGLIAEWESSREGAISRLRAAAMRASIAGKKGNPREKA
jgi:hypothetical protein